MARKKGKVTPFRQETKITYNKYKPNRKARRLGIKPEEPPKREEKKVSKAAVLSESIQRAKEIQKRIVPQGMTYGEYMAYLKERRQQLEEKKQGYIMAKYEVEYALFRKCVIEADSLEEANDKAHTIEDEEIERTETENTGYVVWNEPTEIK